MILINIAKSVLIKSELCFKIPTLLWEFVSMRKTSYKTRSRFSTYNSCNFTIGIVINNVRMVKAYTTYHLFEHGEIMKLVSIALTPFKANPYQYFSIFAR